MALVRVSLFAFPQPLKQKARPLEDGAGDGLLVHGTCVALGDRAVLLRGAPGSGKSDLALRFISHYAAQGAVLVSDDQVQLLRTGDCLVAEAPQAIVGKLEVRGVGIVGAAHAVRAMLSLAVDMKTPNEIDRMPPDPLPSEQVLGVALPIAALDPFEHSAPVKLKLLLTGEI